MAREEPQAMETGGSATLTGTKRLREKEETLAQKRAGATICAARKDGKIIFSYPELDEHVEISKKSWLAAKELGFSLERPFYNSNSYPMQNCAQKPVKIHIAIMVNQKDAAISLWRNQGAPEIDLNNMEVCHLDDNPLNFDLQNLMYAPAAVNRALKTMGTPFRCGRKWTCTITIAGILYSTKAVDSIEEAQHARDILKLTEIPLYMRDIVFQHGLLRPPLFVQDYGSIDLLLSRGPLYKKKIRPAYKRRMPTNSFCIMPFTSLSLKILFSSGNVESFDSSLDFFVQYTGKKGKILEFLIEKTDFHKYLEHFRGCFCSKNNGYLRCDDDLLHVLICDRKRGDHASDGMVVRHAIGGVVGRCDVRKRTLKIGTESENAMDNGKGYRFQGSYKCRVCNDGKTYFLGSFKTEDDAKFVTKFRRDNWRMLMKEVEEFKENNQQVGAHLRARCAEALAKNVTSV